MSTLAIFLLGPPRIEHHGNAITFDTRKAVALLAYLVERRGPVRRETLAQLLWPDYAPERAMANLRRTLWSLHRALGPHQLVATQGEVELVRSAELWVDWDRFFQLIELCRTHGHADGHVCPGCIEPLSEAAGLVRGVFMEGFSLADSAEFDDWQALQIAGVRQRHTMIMRRLIEGWLAQGELGRALELAQRLVELEPLDESAQCRLMLLYAWTGQHAEALRCYREHERLLSRELGLSPEQETTDLFEAIRARREPPRPIIVGSTVRSSRIAPQVSEEPIPGIAGEQTPPNETSEASTCVAREHELGRLEALLQRALAGQPQVVCIIGDAGSGKTALLEAFLRSAQSTHPELVVAAGDCNAYIGMGDPYLPFRQILGLLAGESEGDRRSIDYQDDQIRLLRRIMPVTAQALVTAGRDLLSALLPADALLSRLTGLIEQDEPWFQQLGRLASAGTRPIDPTLQQSTLFEQYARIIRTVAQKYPLLLAIDDLQWADLGSINLLLHLGRRLEGCAVLIVGTYRSAEVALGRQGERHPLESVVNELQRIYGEPAVDLSTAQNRHFIDALLDRQPNQLDEPFRATLYTQTGGHALFTVELLRGMRERGEVYPGAGGLLVAHTGIDWERLPARVDAVIAERIGRLEATDRELLRAASVEGEEFSVELVAHLLGMDEREIARRLSGELDRRHHLVRASGARQVGSRRLLRYRFRHFLIQRYLYGSLDIAERVDWNERMGQTLQAWHGEQTEAVAVQLARHAQEAGRIELTIRFLKQAGDYALRLSANDEATGHYRRALALLNQLPETNRPQLQELELQIALTKPLQLTMGYPATEVGDAFERAMSLGRMVGLPSDRMPLLGRYAHFLTTRGEHRKAQTVAAELLELAMQTEDEAVLLEAFTMQGVVAFYLGESMRAREWLEKARGLYDRERHQSLTYAYGIEPGVHIGIYAMLTYWLLGETERSFVEREETLAVAHASKHPHTLAFALAFSSLFDTLRQDVTATLKRTEESLAVCEEHGLRLMRELSRILRSWAISEAGAPEEGLRLYLLSQEGATEMRVLALMPYLMSLMAAIQHRCGNSDVAIAIIEQALALIDQTGEAAFLTQMQRTKDELQRARLKPYRTMQI
jgi:DNA-binding SARP family transcriptional activator/predicted ATPase